MNASEHEAIDLLTALVRTPSVSGDEAAAARVLVEHAQRLGFETEIDEAGNAIASRGARDARTHIVLLGHLDTVPGDIEVRIEHGELHGRGSVDAKGPLAAMLVAAARVDLAQRNVRLSVVGAVGEETPTSPGARHLATRLRPDACIIGEPSGWDGVTLGYKGRLLVTATSEHDNAHTAGPAPSACDDVLAWWEAARALCMELTPSGSRVFEQVQASVRAIESTSDGLVCRASLDAGFRLPVNVPPEILEARLRDLCADRVSLHVRGRETAYVSDRADAVVRSLSGAIRRAGATPRPKLKTGTSDMNVVGPAWNCPIAAYGPGDSSLDHTPHERLSLAEFLRSIGVLRDAITTLADELAHSTDSETGFATQGGFAGVSR
ncbi:MAG: [LysW]-lysine hydrolase [Phycisphaerales bacterium]|jgi:LysW-gamma-L-lysine carboxypeptidase|nr:[LysW]-lysine hydrolase [Phycisphaerales bacterium]